MIALLQSMEKNLLPAPSWLKGGSEQTFSLKF